MIKLAPPRGHTWYFFLLLVLLELGCSKSTTNDELIARAETLAREGKPADSHVVVDLAERVLRNDPHNRRALFLFATGRSMQADAAIKNSSASGAAAPILAVAAVFHRLRDEVTVAGLDPEERRAMGFSFYNAACVHALNRRYAEAVSALDEAYDVALSGPGLSWKELSDQATSDPDLDGLRSTPEYVAFQAKLRRRVLVNIRDETPADRPEFDRRDMASGQPVSLKNFRGREVALLFWGSWCPASLRLRDELTNLARDPSNGQLTVLGIECEFAPADQIERLSREVLQSHPSTFVNIFADKPMLDGLPSVTRFPTILLLDHEGVVRMRLSGTPEREVITEAIRLVEVPLATSGSTSISK